MTRGRTLRIDLGSELYAHLLLHAEDRDIGIPDLLRHLSVEWLRNNPHPNLKLRSDEPRKVPT